MAPEGAGEDNFFQVFAFANKVTNGFAVGDANDVLGDDRAFVEIRSNVVTGGADDFHTAFVSRVVGAGSGEGGKKGVVDVDDLIREVADKVLRENLHVTSEHDGVDVVFA